MGPIVFYPPEGVTCLEPPGLKLFLQVISQCYLFQEKVAVSLLQQLEGLKKTELTAPFLPQHLDFKKLFKLMEELEAREFRSDLGIMLGELCEVEEPLTANFAEEALVVFDEESEEAVDEETSETKESEGSVREEPHEQLKKYHRTE